MFALLSPLFGIFGSVIPSIMKYFDRKQEIKYELQLIQLKIDAAVKQAELQIDVEKIGRAHV